MKFSKEKTEAIRSYILEKIDSGTENVVQHVSEALDVNFSTVHRYIEKLISEGFIEREKRGQYKLIESSWHYMLHRSEGDLDDDISPYGRFLKDHIKLLPQNVQNIWAYVFSEMINNIIDHSEAENASLTIVNNTLKTTVILVDDGVGIFQKIKNYFDLPTLEDAIAELFKGKVTTDTVNHSGEGIFFSSRLMDEFYIVSSGRIFSCNHFDEENVYRLTGRDFPGTAVIMTLSNQSGKRSQDIFNQFADVDGGFTKTWIPLKNMFDSPPVSRSQAKRLCSHLDQFQEVTLDFAELTWMGQGFAHQLFQVFQAQHPDIRLRPVNMEEGVQKMYNHVVNTDRLSGECEQI